MKRLLPILLLVFSVGVGAETIKYKDGSYTGEVKNGVPHGQGTYTWASGAKYFGEWKAGKQHGHGTLTSPAGDKYVGEFKDGNQHGRGTYKWADGQKYVGEFKDGKEHGQGTRTWPDGETYFGEHKDGKASGIGSLTSASGVRYDGRWKDDKFNGHGTLTSPDGEKYVGEFKDGVKWSGTLYNNGTVKGTYINGKWCQGCKPSTSMSSAQSEATRYNSILKEIELFDAEDRRKRSLAQSKATVNLTLRSNVYGDKVYIDGQYKGSTRLDLKLPKGRYNIRVEKDGHTPYEKTIDLRGDLILWAKLSPREERQRVDDQEDTLKKGKEVIIPWVIPWEEKQQRSMTTCESERREYADGSWYCGELKDNKPHGKGYLHYANGDSFKGKFWKGKLHGWPYSYGTYRWADGSKYEGTWRNDKKIDGKKYDASGNRTAVIVDGDKLAPTSENLNLLRKRTLVGSAEFDAQVLFSEVGLYRYFDMSRSELEEEAKRYHRSICEYDKKDAKKHPERRYYEHCSTTYNKHSIVYVSEVIEKEGGQKSKEEWGFSGDRFIGLRKTRVSGNRALVRALVAEAKRARLKNPRIKLVVDVTHVDGFVLWVGYDLSELAGVLDGRATQPRASGGSESTIANNKVWKGSHTDADGEKYVGEYRGYLEHGRGTYTYADGSKYVGEWKDGNRHGQGTHIWADGGKYVGRWKDDKLNGHGTYAYGKGAFEGDQYVGEWKDGKSHGHGTYSWRDGRRYIGEWKDNQMHGQGTATRSDGSRYVGEWKDGTYHGQGTYIYADGAKYVGEYKHGKKRGHGTFTHADGDQYVGGWKDDTYHGQGAFTYIDGGQYVGEFKAGKKHGQGTYTRRDGRKYVGGWKDGKQHGQGTVTRSDGSTFGGEWKNNKFCESCQKTVRWRRKQAEKGNVDAQNLLATMYVDGNGVPQDYAQAMRWSEKAMMQGSPGAAWNISVMYERGHGVPKNNAAHYAYISVAQALGFTKAEEWLKENEHTFNEYERANGQAMAAQIWEKIKAAKSGESSGSQPIAKERGSTGTGFFINHQGHVITNSHVVEECIQINILHGGARVNTALVTNDPRNDLALLKVSRRPNAIAHFRSGRGIRAGDDILAFGYPLQSMLSDDLKGTKGMINALAGFDNDTRMMQMSAPIQPGNSGGPLLDQAGNVVGVVTAKMNAVKMAKHTGDIPQNVNFALKASLVRDMLEVKDIDYETAPSKKKMETADIFDKAKKFTVLVECLQ